MNETNSTDNAEALSGVDGIEDGTGAEHGESEHPPKPFRAAFREFISNLQKGRRPIAPRDPKQDRTRALVLLIGGIVGSVLLFVGVFSTPPVRPSQEDRDRAQPSLGRKGLVAQTPTASVTPLLNAQTQSDELGQDRLSAADIHNTSQRDVADDPSAGEGVSKKTAVQRNDSVSSGVRDSAPHPYDSSGPVTHSHESALPNTPSSPEVNSLHPIAVGSEAVGFATAPPAINSSPSLKSSIVFVRSAIGAASGPLASGIQIDSARATLLPPGSRLIGRLESAVTSALKTPVVVAIEYNYERDGVVLVPAGTKAIGELQQTSANGYVGIAFHTLQMPDGRNEPIEAVAMDLRNEPLKGVVTGTSGGRKFLTRALTGVGTVAAYVVGSGGSGLAQPITGATLLRDRVAGNVASAGEQELTNVAYAQNVVVTIPAQTRLYIVFQKAAVEQVRPASLPTATAQGAGRSEMPTVQELRELMDLRREINQMYVDSAVQSAPPKP